jgi:hypothetical protein
MLYAVSGTLYNRFALHRRGFDQLPRFSYEAFKEHASVLGEWCRTWVVEKADFYGTAQGLNPNSHQWSGGGSGSRGGFGIGSGMWAGGRRGGTRVPVRGESRRFAMESQARDEEERLIVEEHSSPDLNPASPSLDDVAGERGVNVGGGEGISSKGGGVGSQGVIRL